MHIEKKNGENSRWSIYYCWVCVRGKQSFLKVVEGLREMMKKGVERDIKDIKYKPLDVRKQ